MRGFLGIGASGSGLALRFTSLVLLGVAWLPAPFSPPPSAAADSDLTRPPPVAGDPAPPLLAPLVGVEVAADAVVAELAVAGAAAGAELAGAFMTSLLKIARSFEGLTFLGQKNALNAHKWWNHRSFSFEDKLANLVSSRWSMCPPIADKHSFKTDTFWSRSK